MTGRLATTLQLLDEGLTIYRRNFGIFLLITAGWCIPITIISALLIFNYGALPFSLRILTMILVILLILPISMYFIGVLARAADLAVTGEKVAFRQILGIGVGRTIGMSVFSVIYGMIVQVVTGIALGLSLCPLIFVWTSLITVVSEAGLRTSWFHGISEIISIIFAIIFMASCYALFLLIAGSGYISIIYALHPWAAEKLRFGEAFQQSFDLIAYRFRWNIVTWAFAAVILFSAGISVALVLGLFIPLPILWLIDPNSKVVQAVAFTAWGAGLIVAIPPTPIWMALLYRRNQADRLGSDLEHRIGVWNSVSDSEANSSI